MKDMIQYDDFAKLELVVARVIAVEAVDGADKLWKLTLDAGEELGQRIVMSGIKPWYSTDDLLDKEVIYLANLAPKVLRGVESQGMIIAASDETSVSLLHPDKMLAQGSIVR